MFFLLVTIRYEGTSVFRGKSRKEMEIKRDDFLKDMFEDEILKIVIIEAIRVEETMYGEMVRNG